MSLTIENTKPGVTALVNQGQVSRPLQRQPTSTAFVIGFAQWGPLGVRQTITSWAEYQRVFGGFHPLGYMAEFAYIFFNHFGGKQMVAVRAYDDSSLEYGAINVNDREPVPTQTYRFRAKYPSSVAIKVIITDASNANNVNLQIVCDELKVKETFSEVNLRLSATQTAINAESKLINVSLLAQPLSRPSGRPATGSFVLTPGDDGAESYDVTQFGQLLKEFEDETLGTGQVCIPGYSSVDDVQGEMIFHAEKFNRLAILDSAFGLILDEVPSGNTSSFAAMYYPWVEMKTLDGSGGRKFYPPSIFAAGACAQVDRTIGTHKAPVNIKIPNALDVERNANGASVINDNVREYFNGKNINVIAPIAGEGIKIYGARVLAPAGETRVRFVHERRMLNLIYYSAKIGYAWAVFAVVDGTGRLFRDLRAAGQTFLRNLWRGGALYGATEEEAFLVLADESNNPPEELENGRVHVQLGVKLSPTAEVITVNIDSVPLSENLNVLNGGNQ